MKLTIEQWLSLGLSDFYYHKYYTPNFFKTFKVINDPPYWVHPELLGITDPDRFKHTLLTHPDESYLLALAVQLRLSLT